jgi:hypothetical protein
VNYKKDSWEWLSALRDRKTHPTNRQHWEEAITSLRCLNVIEIATSSQVAPIASNVRTIKSIETDGSPASIFATRD